MAVVDGLLDALVANKHQSLMLTPGRPPRFRTSGGVIDVSNQPFDGNSISSLLREAASGAEPPSTAVGSRWSFTYNYSGQGFDFSAAATPEGWSAVASRSPTTGAGRTAPAQTATPPSPQPKAAPAPVKAQVAPTPALRPAAAAGGEFPDITQRLTMMLQRDASDLHLSAGQKPRMRIEGSLVEIAEWGVPESEQLMESLASIMPKRSVAMFKESNDADFGHEIAGVGRFRINVFRGRLGVGAPSFDIFPSRFRPSRDSACLKCYVASPI